MKDEELKEYFRKQGENLPESILELAEGSIAKAINLIPKQEVYEKMKNLLNNI